MACRVYTMDMATHPGRRVRKNVVLPAELNDEIQRLAAERGTTQSGLMAHLVRLGLASESPVGDDPLLRYIGLLDGPPDLSESVDQTVYQR